MDREMQGEFARVYKLLSLMADALEEEDSQERTKKLRLIRDLIETHRPGSEMRPFTSGS